MARELGNKQRKWTDREAWRQQRGQVAALVAIMMVVLLGVVGLALDGGRLFFLKRDAQNAADAAALRGALAVCKGADVVPPALAAAAANGFDDDAVTNWVAINNPPTRDPGASYYGSPDSVEAVVTATIGAGFVQVVYASDLQITAEAVARCTAGASGIGDSVLWADGDCGTGKEIDLRANNSTVDGDIHSNGGILSDGNNNLVNDGVAAHVTGYSDTGNNNSITPSELDGPTSLEPLWEIEWFEPGTPGGMIAEATKHDMCGDGVWDYHSFTGEWRASQQITGTDVCGVFYVDGDIIVDSDLSGTATFVSTGRISLQDNHHVLEPYPSDWVSCNGDPDCKAALPLPLLFSAMVDPCGNQPVISMKGNNSDWSGAIWGIGGTVAMEGNNATTFDGAVFGYTVDIAGNGFNLSFNADFLPALDEVIVLQR